MAEREMKLIHQLYAESFIRRILRLVELFTNVAQTSAHPLALVSKVASPYMLYLLLNFMLIASPRTKLLSLRIVSNIINIGIPKQVFEQTIKLMEQQPDSLGNKILQSFKTSIKFENSAFLQFLFQYLLSIRSAMFDKQEVQSQGNYEISQDIARIFRRIMTTNDSANEQGKDWNSTIKNAMVNAFNSLEKLSQAEQDALFAIQIGADFTRISIGNPAITNQKQLIVVLGYSETDITGEISADNLKKHQLSYQQQSEKQNLVGLFYDPSQKDKQEIIFVAPHDVKPLLDIDKKEVLNCAKNSALLDPSVLKHFIELLVDEKNTDAAQKIHIIKALNGMMELLPKEFSELLNANQMTGRLINYYLSVFSTQKIDPSKKEQILPVNWLESKATNMRVRALENSLQLQPDKTLTCQIVDQKQLVVSQVDKKTNSFVAQNAFLLSAINLHRVNAQSKMSVHISPAHAPNRRAKATIQNGMVLVDSETLNKLDDDVLALMQGSQSILTHDIKARDFFTQVVKLALGEGQEKKDDEDEEDFKKRQAKWERVLNCVVFIVTRDDWQRIRDFGDPTKESIVKDEWVTKKKESESNFEYFLSQLRRWGGIDTDKLIWHFLQCENYEIGTLQKELPGILEKVAAEEKEYDEKVKDLEKENQTEQLAQVKTARTNLLAERAKTVEEKKQELFKATDNKSIVERLAEQALVDGPEIQTEVKIFDLLEGDKTDIEKNVEKVITDNIAKLGDN